MTISPASSGPAALSTPVEIGVEIPARIQRYYHSKNVEPLHVGPVKVTQLIFKLFTTYSLIFIV
jgi:hypothetical protein